MHPLTMAAKSQTMAPNHPAAAHLCTGFINSISDAIITLETAAETILLSDSCTGYFYWATLLYMPWWTLACDIQRLDGSPVWVMAMSHRSLGVFTFWEQCAMHLWLLLHGKYDSDMGQSPVVALRNMYWVRGLRWRHGDSIAALVMEVLLCQIKLRVSQ